MRIRHADHMSSLKLAEWSFTSFCGQVKVRTRPSRAVQPKNYYYLLVFPMPTNGSNVPINNN